MFEKRGSVSPRPGVKDGVQATEVSISQLSISKQSSMPGVRELYNTQPRGRLAEDPGLGISVDHEFIMEGRKGSTLTTQMDDEKY